MSSSGASADAERPLAAIPVICGPTAAGKSAVAEWLSRRREITVIGADSRQVYRGFDIGTAKPTPDAQRRVPHRAIDVADPTERYSAARWCEQAAAAIAEARGAGRLPVIVGGTGFYIGSLFRPLWEQPPLDAGRRERIQAMLSIGSTEELRRWVAALDPARAHLGRAQLLRAVEVALLTGERLSELHAARARPGSYRPSYLVVDPGAELAARIVNRAAAMLDAGWLDEVDALATSVPDDAPAWNAAGYAVLRQHVRGALSRGEMVERVIVETRQYAKRQRTWFRHQLARDGADVRRLVPGAAGWQETVDRWIAEVDTMANGSADAAR